MTFAEFVRDYATGEIERNPAWRAYDIEAAVRPLHTMHALKSLGYAHSGELGVSLFAAHHWLRSTEDARRLLGIWWVLSRVEQGARMAVPRRRSLAG